MCYRSMSVGRVASLVVAIAAVSLAVGSARAETISLTLSDGGGTSSFNTAGHWSNGLAPTAANDYVADSGHTLRTPATPNNYTFAGHSLTVGDATVLAYKGTGSNTITIDNLTMRNSATFYNAGGAGTTMTLAGNGITLIGTAKLGRAFGNICVTSDITGDGGLLLYPESPTTNYYISLEGVNTYTGSTTITGVAAKMTAGSSLLLDINSTGNSSQILGTGSLTASGTFAFNLDGVTDSGTWATVAGSLSKTYGDSFGVTFSYGGYTVSATETSPGVWSQTLTGVATATFTESSGVLSVTSVPEPGTLALLSAGLFGLVAYAWRKRR